MRKISYVAFTWILLALLAFCSCTAPKVSPTQPTEPPQTSLPAPPIQPIPEPTISNTIPWNEAKNHIGDRLTVYGPVVSTNYAFSSKGSPTFLNIGKNYPDPNRFTVVIWGENRGKFSPPPDISYKGKKRIYVTGLIEEYQGVPEIEVTSPSQIQDK